MKGMYNMCYSIGLCYDDMVGFKDFYPTVEVFSTFIDSITEVAPSFDIGKFYIAMCNVYEWDRLKYVSVRGFNTDFGIIWNSNIYKLNKTIDLLDQDYDHIAGIEISSTQDSTIDIEGDAQQDMFNDPQFDDIEKSITSRSKGVSSSGQVQGSTGNSLTKQKQENIQINEYLEAYRRFIYVDVVKLFDKMFIQIIG